MASVNKVIIVGNLGRDPAMKLMPNGDPIATMAVATSYQDKDRAAGESREFTEWHRICFFGRQAEIVGQYLKKGGSVYVEGHLQTRKYTDKDGIDRYVTEIVGEHMQMLARSTAEQDAFDRSVATEDEAQESPAPGHPAVSSRAEASLAETSPPPSRTKQATRPRGSKQRAA